MIEVVRLSKTYGHQPVLRDLSLAVGAGELVLLVGANGCGKSTTLRVLAGLSRADSGRITWYWRWRVMRMSSMLSSSPREAITRSFARTTSVLPAAAMSRSSQSPPPSEPRDIPLS